MIKQVKFDSWKTTIDGLPVPLYLYYLDPSIYDGSTGDNTVILGQCPDIVSVLYTPLIKKDNLFLDKMVYDVKRYGFTDESGKPSLTNQPDIYRIKSMKERDIKLNDVTIYPSPSRSSNRNWKNEGKLFQYPYYFVTINDYSNEPLEIIPHFCKSNKSEVFARLTLSDKCTHSIYLKGYKGDEFGQLEGMINQANIDLPCSSSAYAQFMASSKNSMLTSQIQGLGNSLLGVGVGIATGSPTAVIGGVMSAMGGVAGASAKMQDLRNTPRSLKGCGSDVVYSRQNSRAGIYLTRWSIPEEVARKIGDFFALYGYKQDKIFTPSIRSRRDYNYIKTHELNLRAKGIPVEHVNKIKELHNIGITFWHVDRNGGIFGDYSKDNIEV